MVTTVTQNHLAINDQTSVLAAGRLYFEKNSVDRGIPLCSFRISRIYDHISYLPYPKSVRDNRLITIFALSKLFRAEK